jgi:hypothetical protein
MSLNRDITEIETAFNFAGSLPVIAIVSGTLRTLAGTIQAVVASVIVVIGIIALAFNRESNEYKDLVCQGLFHCLQGGLNDIRGTVEVALGATIIGPLVLLGAQLLSDRQFAPIVQYS